MEYFHFWSGVTGWSSHSQTGWGRGRWSGQTSDALRVFQGIIMWGKEDKVIPALNKSRKDYTVDRRGDMGAKVGETTFWVKSGF